MDGCPVVEMKRTLKGGWLVPSARDQFKYLNLNIQGSTGGQRIFLGVGEVAVKKPEGLFDMWYKEKLWPWASNPATFSEDNVVGNMVVPLQCTFSWYNPSCVTKK